MTAPRPRVDPTDLVVFDPADWDDTADPASSPLEDLAGDTSYDDTHDADLLRYSQEKVLAYLDALARAGGEPADVDAQGQQDLLDLLTSLRGLLRAMAATEVGKRYGTGRPGTAVQDCVAAGTEAVIRFAAKYDQDRCKYFRKAVSATHSPVRHAMRDIVDTLSLGPMDAPARRVVRRARGIRAQIFAEQNRLAQTEELQCLLREHYLDLTLKNIPEDPDVTREQRIEAAERKMSKRSLSKAIEDLPDLLRATDSIAEPDGYEQGWTDITPSMDDPHSASSDEDPFEAAARVEMAATLARVATGNLAGAQREAVFAHLIGDDSSGAYEPVKPSVITDRYGLSGKDVKALVTVARARLGAPHAQYAHLAPDVLSQFVDPTPTTTPVAAAFGRRIDRPVHAVAAA